MPRRGSFSLVLLLSLLLAAILPSLARPGSAGTRTTGITQAAATTGDIAGAITNQSGKGIFDVLVAIQSGPMLLSARTDSKGKFDLSGLLPGSYALAITKAGFTSQFRGNVNVVVASVTALNTVLIWSDSSSGGVEADITDSKSGQPLSAATVEVKQAGAVVTQGVTDALGVAVLTGIPRGSYRVEVQRTGYLDSNPVAVSVTAGLLTTTAVKLKRDASQVGALTGTVSNSQGGVVIGATVQIVAGPTTGTVTTDNTGTYLFSQLTPDNGYALQVSATGFEQQTIRGITVQPQTTATQDALLVPLVSTTGSIAGTVTDGSGNPLAAATVSIPAGPGLGLSTTTGNNGAYTLANLPPGGGYAVQAQAAGYLPAGASPIIVTAGQTVLENLALTTTGSPTGAIAGTVEDPNSLPLSGVVVTILTGGSSGLSTTTDNAGHYELEQLVPGSNYALSFAATGYTATSITGILVQSGHTTTVDEQLLVQQAPTGGITGVVKKAAGGVLAGATVTLFTGPDSPITTTTASNGSYSFLNLQAAGGYGIQVTDAGWESGETIGISVQAGTTVTVNFSLVQTKKPGTLKGTIQTLLQQPISGAIVEIIAGPTLPNSTQTNGSGSFSFAGLQPGAYAVEVQVDSFQPTQRGNIQVSSGGTTSVTFTLLSAGQGPVGAISGKVTKSGGGAFSGVMVTLVAGPTSPVTVTTNSTGVYAFENLQAGFGYQVQFSSPGWQTNLVTAVQVLNGQVTTVNAALTRNSTSTGIKGQVLDLLSRPVIGATVQVLAGPQIPASVVTDTQGNYAFTSLATGTYTLQASANGFQSFQKDNIIVSAGQSTAVNFTLQH